VDDIPALGWKMEASLCIERLDEAGIEKGIIMTIVGVPEVNPDAIELIAEVCAQKSHVLAPSFGSLRRCVFVARAMPRFLAEASVTACLAPSGRGRPKTMTSNLPVLTLRALRAVFVACFRVIAAASSGATMALTSTTTSAATRSAVSRHRARPIRR
jgi:hypothetical protein